MNFEEIYNRYYKDILFFVRKKLFVLEDAEDVVQETFLRAFKYLEREGIKEHPRALLYKIATQRVINFATRRAQTSDLEEAECVGHPYSPEDSDRVIDLKKLLNRIPDCDLRILRLSCDGYTHKEIAKECDMTTTDVYCILRRVRKNLAKKWNF